MTQCMNLRTKAWFKKATTYAPLVGGLLGIAINSYLPWWVSVASVLIMFVMWRMSAPSWRRQSVRFKSQPFGKSVELVIFAMALVGYYCVRVFCWWLAHGELGVAAGGLPIILIALIIAWWNYPKAMASLA